jgi:regulator of protease activity HflC (stomatin/prohibitin superfamily)
MSLNEAIEQSAEDIAADIPDKSIVAIVAFDSADDDLSEYIMGELSGALFDRGIEVVERNLGYVYRELNLQMSGEVSDETARSIGKFLGADLVITGQLLDMGNTWRYWLNAIHVERAAYASITRLDVTGGTEMRRIIAAREERQRQAAAAEKRRQKEMAAAEKRRQEESTAAEKRRQEESAAAEKRRKEEAAVAEKRRQAEERQRQTEERRRQAAVRKPIAIDISPVVGVNVSPFTSYSSNYGWEIVGIYPEIGFGLYPVR